MNTRDIYVRVLAIVEYFLRNAAHLSVSDLQNYDPSIEQLEADIKRLALILKALSSSYEDENMAINALQCCFVMGRLARAVRNNSDDELTSIFKELEMHTRVP